MKVRVMLVLEQDVAKELRIRAAKDDCRGVSEYITKWVRQPLVPYTGDLTDEQKLEIAASHLYSGYGLVSKNPIPPACYISGVPIYADPEWTEKNAPAAAVEPQTSQAQYAAPAVTFQEQSDGSHITVAVEGVTGVETAFVLKGLSKEPGEDSESEFPNTSQTDSSQS